MAPDPLVTVRKAADLFDLAESRAEDKRANLEGAIRIARRS